MEVVYSCGTLEDLVQHETGKASLLHLNHGGQTVISLKGEQVWKYLL